MSNKGLIIVIATVILLITAAVGSAELEKKTDIRVVAVPDCEEGVVFFLAYTGTLPDYGLVGPEKVITSEQSRYVGMTAMRDQDVLKTYCGLEPDPAKEVKVNCDDHVVCYFGQGCFYGNAEMMKKYCNLGKGQNGEWEFVAPWATPGPSPAPTQRALGW
jgi:hypothetical protein